MYLKNLGRAIVRLMYESKSFLLLFYNFDCFLNALSGGDYRATISARVGFFSMQKENLYWQVLEWIIDETFRALDGSRHCFRAYLWEQKQKREKRLRYRRGNDFALFLLSLFVIVGCCLLCIPIWLLSKVIKRR